MTRSRLASLVNALAIVNALALACAPSAAEGEGEGAEGEGAEGEGDAGEGEGDAGEGEGEGEGEREISLRFWNVATQTLDARFDPVPLQIARAEILPEVSLQLSFALPDVASVRFVFDGATSTATAPFRVSESALDLGVGVHTLDVTELDASGAELAHELLTLQITDTGLDPTPADGAHALAQFWLTDAGVRVHKDGAGNFVDDTGALVLASSDVQSEDRGAGQVFLVAPDGGPQLAFAFELLVPDGFSAAVAYPLFVVLHHGYESYRGTDLDPILLDQPPVGALTKSDLRHRFPAVVLVPQLQFHDELAGVQHEWAAFTNIDGVSGNCTSAPDFSLGGAFVRGVIDDLVAGALSVDGAAVRVDAGRLYLTGHSMGGLGTWDFIAREPALWAAAVPMAGYPDFSRAQALVDTPIWAFHHEIDCYNAFAGTATMFSLVTDELGGRLMKFTALDFDTGGACDQAHFQTPDHAFADDTLMPWIFSQAHAR